MGKKPHEIGDIMSRRRNKPRPTTFRQVVWQTFSETDDQFLDLFRVGYALGLLSFLALSAYDLFFKGGSFDPMEWAGGFATILFGGGAAVGIRGRLEDGPSNHLEDVGGNPYIEGGTGIDQTPHEPGAGR